MNVRLGVGSVSFAHYMPVMLPVRLASYDVLEDVTAAEQRDLFSFCHDLGIVRNWEKS